jgi:hypothetical protein
MLEDVEQMEIFIGTTCPSSGTSCPAALAGCSSGWTGGWPGLVLLMPVVFLELDHLPNRDTRARDFTPTRRHAAMVQYIRHAVIRVQLDEDLPAYADRVADCARHEARCASVVPIAVFSVALGANMIVCSGGRGCTCGAFFATLFLF